MTNYKDLPTVPFVYQELNQYLFKKEYPDNLRQHIRQAIVELVKQRGFHDYDPQCIDLLQQCWIDCCKDLFMRFKQHFESLDTSITVQDAIERTLSDVISINLQELICYMKAQR